MAYDDDEDEGYDKPVEEGKTYTIKVEDLGSKGDGIARVEGFVVFVPETEVGETVRVEVNSVGRKFAFAEVIDRDVDESELETDDEDRYDKDEVEEDEDDLEPDETLGEPDSDEEWDGPGSEDAEMDEPEQEGDSNQDEDDRYDKDEVDDDREDEDLDAPATEEELENDLGVDDEQMRRPDEL